MTTDQSETTTTRNSTPPRRRRGTRSPRGTTATLHLRRLALANEALRLVGLEASERFLDVAAGTGGLSLPAARLGALVLATDWSPAMIDHFEARVRKERLGNAQGRVMDCHALDLPDDSFDVAASQFGVMLVPDQPRALREMVRVTRAGGRVLVIAYGFPAELEFLHFFISALKTVAPEFPGLPDDPPPLEFQVSDPEVLRQRLIQAGLKNVRIDQSAERPTFASGQEMWDWVLHGNPIPGMLVADLTENQRAHSGGCSTACSASAQARTAEQSSGTRSTSASGRRRSGPRRIDDATRSPAVDRARDPHGSAGQRRTSARG